MNDLVFAVRQLTKHWRANLVIVLTIGLLAGAISTIYAAIRAYQKASMPFADPNKLAKLWRLSGSQARAWLPADLCNELREHAKCFSAAGVFAYGGNMNLTDIGEVESLQVSQVSASLLAISGFGMRAGRFFLEEEATARAQVVVLKHDFWKRKFDGDKNIVGRVLRLNGQEFTVIGILPSELDRAALTGAIHAEVWRPWDFRSFVDAQGNRQSDLVEFVGRVRNDWTLSQAQAEIDRLWEEIERHRTPSLHEKLENLQGPKSLKLAGLEESLSLDAKSRAEQAAMTMFLSGIGICVVLIACSNIMSLLLARVATRRREVAIRASLGAARSRLVRQFLVESGLLGLVGGVAGLFIAAAIFGLLRSQDLKPAFDPELYVLCTLSALLLGLGVGLLPALRSSRCDLTQSLKDGGRGVSSPGSHRLQDTLVSLQVAMAVVLCVAAGLFTRGLLKYQFVTPQYDPQHVLLLQMSLRSDAYRFETDSQRFVDSALRTLESIPGVRVAAIASPGGVLAWNFPNQILLEGVAEARPVTAPVVSVSANFHRLVGTRLRRGRGFSLNPAAARQEALVSQRFADRHLPGIDPLGKRVSVGTSQGLTIVGVFQDPEKIWVHDREYSEGGEVHVFEQRGGMPSGQFQILISTEGPASPLAKIIREAIRAMDANQPVGMPIAAAAEIARVRLGQRSIFALFLTLAGCGLFLALIGVYGVISQSVAERTHEIGVRMALGAGRSNIRLMVILKGFRLTLFGLVPGAIIASLVTSRLPRAALDGIPALDGWTYGTVVLVMLGTAFFATAIPAWRAASLDPMNALRDS